MASFYSNANPWHSLHQEILSAGWVANVGIPTSTTILLSLIGLFLVIRQIRQSNELILKERHIDAVRAVGDGVLELYEALEFDPRSSPTVVEWAKAYRAYRRRELQVQVQLPRRENLATFLDQLDGGIGRIDGSVRSCLALTANSEEFVSPEVLINILGDAFENYRDLLFSAAFALLKYDGDKLELERDIISSLAWIDDNIPGGGFEPYVPAKVDPIAQDVGNNLLHPQRWTAQAIRDQTMLRLLNSRSVSIADITARVSEARSATDSPGASVEEEVAQILHRLLHISVEEASGAFDDDLKP